MKRKTFSVVCVLMLLLVNLFAFPVSAEETECNDAVLIADDETKTSGLINYYSLSISGGTRKLYLSASTTASETMSKIGFKDISVQYSTNGVSGWTEEKTLGDDLKPNARSHSKHDEEVPVQGGRYYRVVLNHYAKETGWLFPGSESIQNTSNVVWVSG